MSDDEDQPDEVSERFANGDDLLSMFDSQASKRSNINSFPVNDDADQSLEHSVDENDDDERRFLHRRRDRDDEDASFDHSVDDDRRRTINDDVDEDVGQSPLPRPRRRDHGDDGREDEGEDEDDEDSRLSLANIDDVEEPPPLPPAEKRFAIDELPVLLKRLKMFADENRRRQNSRISSTTETIEEVRRREELEAFIKVYRVKIEGCDGEGQSISKLQTSFQKSNDGVNKSALHLPRIPLPKFYAALPQEENVLRVKLREEARTLLLQKKSAEVLSSEAMEALWPILDKHFSQPVVGEEKMMNFDDFVAAGKRDNNNSLSTI